MKQLVKEMRWIKGADLVPNKDNWRQHPRDQVSVFKRLVEDIGFASALIGFENENGKIELIDGHLRAGLKQEALLPIIILDVDRETAREIILTLDPLASMAMANETKAAAILDRVRKQAKQILKDMPQWSPYLAELPKFDPEDIKAKIRNIIICPDCGCEIEL